VLRLVSWNIRQGGGKRIDAQTAFCAQLGPDVVCLQEVSKTSRHSYRAALAAAGLPYAIDSFELAADPTLLRGPRRYGELIASRWPLDPLADRFDAPWPERILSAQISSEPPLEVHTTGIPPGSSNGWVKVEMLEAIYRGLARPSAIARILCGDFNLPQAEGADGEVMTWGQRRRPDGRLRICRRIRGGPGERWDRAERAIATGIEAHDLADVYRQINGYQVRAASWYTTTGIGRRFDHVFASARLEPVRCDYCDEARVRRLSDHAPVVADFAGVPAGAH
jgi:exonuclease III